MCVYIHKHCSCSTQYDLFVPSPLDRCRQRRRPGCSKRRQHALHRCFHGVAATTAAVLVMVLMLMVLMLVVAVLLTRRLLAMNPAPAATAAATATATFHGVGERKPHLMRRYRLLQ